jgi:hypothetical protein
MRELKMQIHVAGGCLQGVCTNFKDPEIEVELVDWDTLEEQYGKESLEAKEVEYAATCDNWIALYEHIEL